MIRYSQRPSGAIPSEPIEPGGPVLLPKFDYPAAEALAHSKLLEPRPVLDQGDVLCCVSVAVTAAMEIVDHADGASRVLSPLYHYYLARPNPADDSGLVPSRGLMVASVSGVARLALHAPPLTKAGAAVKPDGQAYADGPKQRIDGGVIAGVYGYRRVPPNTEMSQWKAALMAKHPVVLVIWLSDGYDRITAANPRHEDVVGVTANAHAVVITGFSDTVKAFWIRDSRGTAFGTDGHWYLPYALVNSTLVVESWVVSKLTY